MLGRDAQPNKAGAAPEQRHMQPQILDESPGSQYDASKLKERVRVYDR